MVPLAPVRGEERRCYSDSCSDDSFIEDEYEDDMEWRNHIAHVSAPDSLPPHCARKSSSWRSDCTISFDEADMDGTWELPFLTASDCAGEHEMICYILCTSAMAFEDSAAAAVSRERHISLAGHHHGNPKPAL